MYKKNMFHTRMLKKKKIIKLINKKNYSKNLKKPTTCINTKICKIKSIYFQTHSCQLLYLKNYLF